MKKIVVYFLFAFVSGQSFGQKFQGAWERFHREENEDVKTVMVVADGFLVATTYTLKGRYIGLSVQKWSLNGNVVDREIEYDSDFPEWTGDKDQIELEFWGDRLTFKGSTTMVWTQIDDETPGELAGAWIINSRIKEGMPQSIDTNRPRKTMKILSGTRFQWIAYNTETGEFHGTGGGTYTTENGKYTENIEFFSRDINRVGASLDFNFEIVNGDWRHTGKSSKGNPINETWGRRK